MSQFPRVVWAGSTKNSGFGTPRMVVNNKTEYANFIKSYNNKMNVYTSVYDFTQFRGSKQVDASVIVDRAFLDFDSHGKPISSSWEDTQIVVKKLVELDYKFTYFFSGNGFHVFVFGIKTNGVSNIRPVQAFWREVQSWTINGTLDGKVIQTSRLRRVPNTVNMNSNSNEEIPYYCIPLLIEDIDKPVKEILSMAMKPRLIPKQENGNNLVEWPDIQPIQLEEAVIDIPERKGSLPLIPCLYSAIMVENPSHEARVYLVQWYRDMLSLGNRNLGQEDKDVIIEMIFKEIENIAKQDEVWIDWNANTTRKAVEYIVNGGYNAPQCDSALIPKGYCIGRCWRYPNTNDTKHSQPLRGE
tara:strand:- start:662 stop:1729 length:1068 start_codon:yes stop_codon:yes gene_type:complete